MQTLDWYYRRLIVMSPSEIALRIRSSLRDHTDKLLAGRRQHVRKPSVILNGDGSEAGPGFRVSNMAVGDKTRLNTSAGVYKQWYDSLIARAGQVADHRLSFFDQKDKHLGDPIIWNRDHKRGQDVADLLSDEAQVPLCAGLVLVHRIGDRPKEQRRIEVADCWLNVPL